MVKIYGKTIGLRDPIIWIKDGPDVKSLKRTVVGAQIITCSRYGYTFEISATRMGLRVYSNKLGSLVIERGFPLEVSINDTSIDLSHPFLTEVEVKHNGWKFMAALVWTKEGDLEEVEISFKI